MKDLFRKAGRVLHTDIHTDIGSRRPNGSGTVIFDCSRTALIAIGKTKYHSEKKVPMGLTFISYIY